MLQWAKLFGGVNSDRATHVVVDAAENTYVAGEFYADDLLAPAYLPNTRDTDVYVAKLDVAGNVDWVKPISTYGDDAITSMFATPDGKIAVTGTKGAWMPSPNHHPPLFDTWAYVS